MVMLPKRTKKLQHPVKETRNKILPKKLKLAHKIEQYTDQLANVTLKDQKENFKTKLPCWLINPVKSEIGIVSKVELEKINSNNQSNKMQSMA